MRRIIGAFLLAVACLVLGKTLDFFRDGQTTLAHEYEYRVGGEYD